MPGSNLPWLTPPVAAMLSWDPLKADASGACSNSCRHTFAGCVLGKVRRVWSATCFISQLWGTMFMSVWYAKKMGSRFLKNVRKTKRYRHQRMVGNLEVLYMSVWLFHFKNLKENAVIFEGSRLKMSVLYIILIYCVISVQNISSDHIISLTFYKFFSTAALGEHYYYN